MSLTIARISSSRFKRVKFASQNRSCPAGASETGTFVGGPTEGTTTIGWIIGAGDGSSELSLIGVALEATVGISDETCTSVGDELGSSEFLGDGEGAMLGCPTGESLGFNEGDWVFVEEGGIDSVGGSDVISGSVGATDGMSVSRLVGASENTEL